MKEILKMRKVESLGRRNVAYSSRRKFLNIRYHKSLKLLLIIVSVSNTNRFANKLNKCKEIYICLMSPSKRISNYARRRDK